METYDLIVIGSGPAGRRAAVQAAKLGRSVLVVEERLRVGGVSVHTGTIPSKTLREAALSLSGRNHYDPDGPYNGATKQVAGADLGTRLRATLDHEIEVLEHQLARNGVQTFGGSARLADPHTVAVTSGSEERSFTADKLVIAVGTEPSHPPQIPFNDRNVFDSDSIATGPDLPASMTVVGAGVIGIEYATIFSALGVPVTLVEPNENFLEYIDGEIVDAFVHHLRKHGVQFRLGAMVDRVEIDDDGFAVSHLADGRTVRTEMLLYTAGRMGATANLGLETCGLEADERGRLKVDPATYQTDVPHIYAAGDVIGFPSLASVSMEQGRIAACHAFGAPMPPAPEHFPYGIYAVPEISTVGLSERQVRDSGTAYEVGLARFRETSRGQILGLECGVLKMVFSAEDRRLLGVHILGESATELIHVGQAVLNLGGTIDYFIENAFNYPTLSEGYKIAALDAYNRMGPPRDP